MARTIRLDVLVCKIIAMLESGGAMIAHNVFCQDRCQRAGKNPIET